MADTTTELEVLDEIVDVLGGQSGQHKTVVPVLEDIRDLLGGGSGGGGYNPALSVGRADALTGADETAQWAQRESTGSGSAIVRSVQGAAVAFAQMCYTVPKTLTAKGVTYTCDADGEFTVSGNVTESSAAQFTIGDGRRVSVVQGHKYISRGGNGSTVGLYIGGIASNMQPNAVYTANSTAESIINLYVEPTFDGNSYSAKPQLFDLTAIFGAGNEPQTVAEFNAMYPEPYYPYSAPTLQPARIAGIASTDAQGGELDAIEWTSQTLRAAGTIRDELTADELVTCVGVVDLGTLTWNISTDDRIDVGYHFRAVLPNGAVSPNKECAKYTVIKNVSGLTNVINAYGSAVDKVVFSASGSTGAVYVIDSTYTDAADFKTAMAGVLLFYELATPTTTPISPALPMTYRVEQGGTESIVVPDGEISAVPVLTIAEGESAADVVMDALACIATPDGPVATSSHAVNTYLTMQGKLYKVTSAIAVGETIKAGTNITETTVMAELLALTA